MVIKTWRVKSETDSQKEYVVTLDNKGQYTCSCPGWRFRYSKLGRDCKHIMSVKNNPESRGLKPTRMLHLLIPTHGRTFETLLYVYLPKWDKVHEYLKSNTPKKHS